MIPRAHSQINRLARLAALLLFAFSLSVPVWPALTEPALAQPSAISNIPDNPYSANVFLDKEVEEWKIEQTIRMASEANIQWIKQEFPWQEIEFRKGYFHDDKWNKSSWEKFDRIVDLADKYKVKVIARVSHPPAWAKSTGGGVPLNDNKDLADFTNALLDHYQGRIKYVQVWNEPNLAAEWIPGKAVDPKGYADMMKVVYPAVKAAHPEAVIQSAPMAITLEGTGLRGNMNDLDYWNGLYDAGVKGNFDIASANAYGLDQPPDAAPGPQTLNFRRVELLRDVMVKNGDSDRSIWLNEYGWNASPESLSEAEKNYWRHVTEAQQAQWTVDGIEYARKHWPWAGAVSIWYFRQVGDIPPDKAEYYFRLVNPDFTTAPVYDAVKADARQYPGPASQPEPTPAFLQPTPTLKPPTQGIPIHVPTSTRAPTNAPAQPTRAPVAPSDTAAPVQSTGPTVSTPAAATSPTQLPAEPTLAAPPVTATTQSGALLPTTVSTSTIISVSTQLPSPTAGTTVAASGGGNTLLFVLGGALVAAGLAGLGYYFMRSKQAS